MQMATKSHVAALSLPPPQGDGKENFINFYLFMYFLLCLLIETKLKKEEKNKNK